MVDIGDVIKQMLGSSLKEMDEKIRSCPDAIDEYLRQGIDGYLTRKLSEREYDVCIGDLIKHLTQHPSIEMHFNYHKDFFPVDVLFKKVNGILSSSPYWRKVTVDHQNDSPKHSHFRFIGARSEWERFTEVKLQHIIHHT